MSLSSTWFDKEMHPLLYWGRWVLLCLAFVLLLCGLFLPLLQTLNHVEGHSGGELQSLFALNHVLPLAMQHASAFANHGLLFQLLQGFTQQSDSLLALRLLGLGSFALVLVCAFQALVFLWQESGQREAASKAQLPLFFALTGASMLQGFTYATTFQQETWFVLLALTGFCVGQAWFQFHVRTPHGSKPSPWHASHWLCGAFAALLGFEAGWLLPAALILGLFLQRRREPHFFMASWLWKSYVANHRGVIVGFLGFGLLYLLGCWQGLHQLPPLHWLEGWTPLAEGLRFSWPQALLLLGINLLGLWPWGLLWLASLIDTWVPAQKGGRFYHSLWQNAKERSLMRFLSLGVLACWGINLVLGLSQHQLPLWLLAQVLQTLMLSAWLQRLYEQQVPCRFHKIVWEASAVLILMTGLFLLWATLIILPSQVGFEAINLPLPSMLEVGDSLLIPLWKAVALLIGFLVFSFGVFLLLLMAFPFCSLRLSTGLAGGSLCLQYLTLSLWLPQLFPNQLSVQLPTLQRWLATSPVQSSQPSDTPLRLGVSSASANWLLGHPRGEWLPATVQLEVHPIAKLTQPNAPLLPDFFVMNERFFYHLPQTHPLRKQYLPRLQLGWWQWQPNALLSASLQESPLAFLLPWCSHYGTPQRLLLLQHIEPPSLQESTKQGA